MSASKYDIVKNPRMGNGRACVVLQVPSGRFHEYVLAPFTKVGYPSINRSNFIYLKSEANLQPWTKQGADTHLKFCPDCCERADSIYYNPLRKLSVYEEKWQCKNCKRYLGSSEI